MLYVARALMSISFLLVITPLGLLLCLVQPFHYRLVYLVSRPLSWACTLFGFQLQVQNAELIERSGPCVLICNHQDALDLLIGSKLLPLGAVTLGKKSLKWIPILGLFYWLSGNLMVDRNHSAKAAKTLEKAARRIRKEKLKVWIFPEGTRNYHQGLLRFKTGAFRLAQQAGVPVIPICVANTCNIQLNRWNNGVVPVRVLEPISVSKDDDPRVVADKIHQQMAATIEQLTPPVSN